MEFTKAQKQAIYTSGSSLLVSAAAGSGKTAVLVQRVIEKILAGTDITGLWIMTFTNAAAAEMRLKIEKAVAGQLEREPDNAHLQRQSLLLPSANISTVHSLCKKLIDMNFQQLGLDPSVGIAEESVLEIIFQRTLEEFVEELYERGKTQADIREMIAFFSGGRSDAKLMGVLQSAYRLYEEQPFPKTEYHTQPDLFANFRQDGLYRAVFDKLEEARTQYEQLLDDPCYGEFSDTALWKSMASEREGVLLASKYLEKRDFDGVGKALEGITFGRWDTRAKVFKESGMDLENAKGVRTYAKNLITSLRDNIFNKSADRHLQEMRVMHRVLTTLFTCIAQLDDLFAQAKKEKSVISFADMERLALRLLVASYDEDSDTLIPSPLALSMREEITEIVVDEYQDTNRKQEMIFRALSREGENVFMVGDVKQSIYRFRGACPELFMDKKQNAAPVGEGYEITSPSYLYLNQNFRSHPTVLSFANQIFRTAMSVGLGQIDYDTSEQLYPGGLYPEESGGHVELDIVFTDTEPVEEVPLTAIEKEAALVAEKIRSLLGKPFYDVKSGGERPLNYGDIAILCRVTGGVTGHFETALRRKGINCINNNQDQQFLDVWEVKMLRSYLQVISNPYRDIPLITLMYSDFYGFTAAELARIRTCAPKGAFYDAVRLAAEKDAKCAAFLKQVEDLRYASVGRRTDEILQMIFAVTHILEKIAAYPDGSARVANMRLMLRYASDYEKNSYKGLFAYLNYLDKMSALGKILPGARSPEAPEQCVQLLSVHKSKGLEYPVCFIVNLSKAYRDRESDTLITHPELGEALVMREDENFTEYTSLPYAMIKEANRREALSEEMRILYVALTRPKTHLYLVASGERDKLRDLLSALTIYQGSKPSEFLAESPSALRWILYALRHQQDLRPLYSALDIPCGEERRDCSFVTQIYEDVSVGGFAVTSKKEMSELDIPLDLIRRQYPYEAHTKLPVKLSVSEVKGMREQDPEALPLIPAHFGRQQPGFLSGRVAGNMVGNAVHRFMQFADFAALAAPGGFEAEKERLLTYDFLTQKEIALVPEAQIRQFVSQPLFKDMITSDKLGKEKRFFFSLPARRIYPKCGVEDPILLQGVLDCYYEKNGELYIVDYKTDRLNDAAQFEERYGVQLRLYRYALRQLTGKKADKLYLYSFHLNEVIEIS